ncbi:MAG: F0F1 ATP synthase subunit A [Peptococcaceae bacterium]|jgi:F-type H+-transporting ATPase subunit a|nr:F0F1 ATP synthase subunit A [Peptococcaceae bacterium]MDH7523720.1 F0F1 ATP synthase subunit A [Peptococcaceae bacterium]
MFLATPVYAAEAAEKGAEHSRALFSLFGLEVSSVVTTMWGLMLLITLLAYLATRKLEKVPESRLQNFMEFGLEAILGLLSQVMGKEKLAKRYFPLLASFFILILASNYSGLLPGAGHIPGLQAPTSTLSVTAGFALVVFVSTHYYGVKTKGIKYFRHFIEPLPFLLPLNIIEEFVKPLSLSLRLYGNIFGEEMVVASLFALVPLFLPLPMMLLGVLFGLIQAFVFTMLAALYIATATAEHH